MDFQIDTNNHRTQEVRVGVNSQEVACFRKANFFIHNLQAEIEGSGYQLKLAAPWNGFRFQLRQGDRELATARQKRRMHAFDEDRPLIRHPFVEFDLDVGGRSYCMTPEDRHGLSYVLSEGESEIGRLAMRTFEEQKNAEWKADLSLPDDWGVPLAAFVAWIGREGRARMSA